MANDPDLFLHEEILLLALRDEEGTAEFGTWYQQALGGAILAELLLRGRIAVDDTRRKHVRVLDPTPVADPVIDDCLRRIDADSTPRAAQYWVSRFATLPELKDRVARGLCRRGILRADVGKVLLIFSRKIYPEVDPRPEQEIVARLRSALTDAAGPVDARTTVLLSLADATGILRATFGKRVLERHAARLARIKRGEAIGAAVEATQAAQAAMATTMFLVISMPTIAASGR